MSAARMKLLVFSAGLAFAAAALAADYPARPVKVIVTYPPGGGMDTMARILATPLQDRLKQPIVIENRPGASGMIGTEATARSAPDGYTLTLASADTHAINPAVFTNIRYDAIKDFTPIALLGDLPMTLIVKPSIPVNNVGDFLRYVKERPGALSYSSWGVGSGSQIAMESLLIPAGAKMLHVPFAGAAPAIAAIMGGQIDAMMVTLPTSEPNHIAGKVRILGVTAIKRPAGSPDYPRAGMPPVALWIGVLGPAKMPADIVGQLNRELRSMMDDQAIRASFAKVGLEPVASVPSSAEFGRFLEQSAAQWGKTVRDANIKVDLK